MISLMGRDPIDSRIPIEEKNRLINESNKKLYKQYNKPRFYPEKKLTFYVKPAKVLKENY